MEEISALQKQWNNRALFRLLWPLMLEQILGVSIGIADTVMVTSVGEFAVSGVSIVDTINVLLMIAFGALATGGSVVVSQYIGRRDLKKAERASMQLMYTSVAVSLVIMLFTLLLYGPILSLIYGRIDAEVMTAARTYFWLSALSYPFLAVYNASASLFRSMGNSRVTMLVALLVNLVNIGGNAFFIFGLGLGVLGAGLATLISRIAAALVLTALLMSRRSQPISLAGLFKIRIEPALIRSILNIGIPSGLENSMFQFGKILLARIVSSFGTAAIAANAISGSISSFVYMPGQGFGIALVTLVGQCMGAMEYHSAKKYTAKIIKISYCAVVLLNIFVIIFMESLVGFFKLSPEAAVMAKNFLLLHCISSSLLWPLGFILPNTLRASGDAHYCMVVASITMWTVRVTCSFIFAYILGFGALGVWIGMSADFLARSVCYSWRYLHGRWQTKKVIT
jgi:putative MATE family efflux protein